MSIIKFIITSSAKLILFSSSYIPLLFIIILQMLRASLDSQKCPFNFTDYTNWRNLVQIHYFYWILAVLAFCFLLVIMLKITLTVTRDPNLLKSLTIETVNNVSSCYITNYLAVYIFPFITLNLTSLDGVGTVIILTMMIGYVYIKNDILYINPVLNILFKYNIFSVIISSETSEIILLSKKPISQLKINPSIQAYRIGYNIFIEL